MESKNFKRELSVNEYMVEVEIDNTNHTLKTFSRSVVGAVDNMVKLDGVNKLFNILNADTLETWEFSEDIQRLREMRKGLPDNIEMFFSLEKVEE